MNRAAILILAVGLFSGCAAPAQPEVLSDKDWKYSEIVSVVDAFRKRQGVIGGDVSQRIRSIYPDGGDSLRVYLSNMPGFRGSGYELTLKRSPSGTWVVASFRFFNY
jgi:hypothetical protein